MGGLDISYMCIVAASPCPLPPPLPLLSPVCPHFMSSLFFLRFPFSPSPRFRSPFPCQFPPLKRVGWVRFAATRQQRLGVGSCQFVVVTRSRPPRRTRGLSGTA